MHTIKSLRTAILLVLPFLLCLNPCIAEERHLISTGEWKPYTSAEMEGYGFFSEIVTAAFQEAGIEVMYGFAPWKRCEAYVQVGKTFAAFPFSITDERKTYAYFSDPVSHSTTVFFYNTNKHKVPINFERLNDLKPYSIIGVLGYFYTETFKKEMIDVEYVSTEEKALELIFHERYDLLPVNNFVGWNLIKINYPGELNTFSTCKTPLSKDTLHLMVSKRYPNSRELMNKFNAALFRIKNNGIYQKIMSAYSPLFFEKEH